MLYQISIIDPFIINPSFVIIKPLNKKGRCEEAIARISNLYSNSLSIVFFVQCAGESHQQHQALHQPADGGLGLHHVQLRALAYQISCFLETSCNPVYRRNQYHEALFLFHVLGEDIPEDIPPFFKREFFPTLRRLNATPLSLSKVSLKEIYRFLIEEITILDEEPDTRTLKPLRTELANPATPWDIVWPSSRQHKLGPSLCSFLFKLLHQILPTAESSQDSAQPVTVLYQMPAGNHRNPSTCSI